MALNSVCYRRKLYCFLQAAKPQNVFVYGQAKKDNLLQYCRGMLQKKPHIFLVKGKRWWSCFWERLAPIFRALWHVTHLRLENFTNVLGNRALCAKLAHRKKLIRNHHQRFQFWKVAESLHESVTAAFEITKLKPMVKAVLHLYDLGRIAKSRRSSKMLALLCSETADVIFLETYFRLIIVVVLISPSHGRGGQCQRTHFKQEK